ASRTRRTSDLGRDPEQWQHRPVELLLQSPRERHGGERLVDRVERAAEQARLLAGRDEQRAAADRLLEASCGGRGCRPDRRRHGAPPLRAETAVHLLRLAAVRLQIPWRSREERREPGAVVQVILDEAWPP